ncbi:MAG: hypothetical protein KDC90_17305, partial [Ignavibacteriae bacterium]|nr:hypothetical protein [Ignavibacteriota bacterium]
MQRFLYIVNPISGKGRGRKLIPLIEKFLNDNNIAYELKISEYHLHTTEIVKQNIANFDTIICVGGDGTLNEIVNGIPEDAFDHVNLGVLPIGTGNDFVKNIKLHKELLKNLSIFSGLISNKIRSTDVGMIDFKNSRSNKRHSHLFINAAGLGFDAQVGALTKNNKILSGKLAYLFSVMKAMINFDM